VTLRYGNVYGPRQDVHGEAGVVAIFCGALLAGERPTVFGDGRQTRDYVYVGDVADAVARAVATADVTGIANIGTGAETTVNELYRQLARLTNVQRPAEHGPAKPGEQRRSLLDAARAKSLLGWSATTPLDHGLTQTVEWFRKELKR
jgi:UDP-glucose 4-epimerase